EDFHLHDIACVVADREFLAAKITRDVQHRGANLPSPVPRIRSQVRDRDLSIKNAHVLLPIPSVAGFEAHVKLNLSKVSFLQHAQMCGMRGKKGEKR
ncbi:MAG: hypothetical protein AB7K24_11090, partial [Gemmataceae bacterium]